MGLASDHTVGLYLHVPYCRALCHYCDFAKTANWDNNLKDAYLDRLVEHTKAWLAALGRPLRLGSLFLGGGTPSIYSEEYASLLDVVRPYLEAGAELTLEANPDDLTRERLKVWKQLGFNRLSIGVQTFDERGLRFMRRMHSGQDALAAVATAREIFDDFNLDLIYGWPSQTVEGLQSDIERAIALGATHLSLYTLTYESRTPIGRAAARGRIAPAGDDFLANLYDLARALLAEQGFLHEEVSNWARPGFEARHNALYWRDQDFLGVGVGAHGYISGLRYHYRSDDRRFVRGLKPTPPLELSADAIEAAFDLVVDRERDEESWLIEYLGSGLRSIYGISVPKAERRTGRQFVATPLLAHALSTGAAHLSATGILTLMPAEWFRETSWSLEVLKSFCKI